MRTADPRSGRSGLDGLPAASFRRRGGIPSSLAILPARLAGLRGLPGRFLTWPALSSPGYPAVSRRQECATTTTCWAYRRTRALTRSSARTGSSPAAIIPTSQATIARRVRRGGARLRDPRATARRRRSTMPERSTVASMLRQRVPTGSPTRSRSTFRRSPICSTACATRSLAVPRVRGSLGGDHPHAQSKR